MGRRFQRAAVRAEEYNLTVLERVYTRTKCSWHSPKRPDIPTTTGQMDPILDKFGAAIHQMTPSPECDVIPAIPPSSS